MKPQARVSPRKNWLKCYHSGNSLETQHSRFYGGGPATQAASAWHRRQFETPWRKAGVQYKPYCLHSLGKASLLSPRAGGNLSKIQVPRHQPRQPCKQACHVEKVGSTLLVSFCMCAISRGNHENNSSEREGFFF